jgi:hypothetical protein
MAATTDVEAVETGAERSARPAHAANTDADAAHESHPDLNLVGQVSLPSKHHNPEP